MGLMSLLYFECHITVEPLTGDRLNRFKDIARRHQFRVADLLMQKSAGETLEPSNLDSFCTGRSKDYEDLWSRMYLLITELKADGIHVWRYKIEDTILDSRIKDASGLLVAPATLEPVEG